MELIYDRAALQEFMDSISSIHDSLMRKRDSSMAVYNTCRQQYTRLSTEIEQKCRTAYNKVEEADSLIRMREEEYQTAVIMLENARDEKEQEVGQQRLRKAQLRRTEAVLEKEKASEEYEKTKSQKNNLANVWEKYQSRIDAVARRVEDGFSAFSILERDGNQDLGEYIGFMDKAQNELSEFANYSSNRLPSNDNNSSSVSTIYKQSSGEKAFKSKEGNVVGLSVSGGIASVVLNIAGRQQSFPDTKSGRAKAYRAALKSGDKELISETNKLYSNAGVLMNSSQTGTLEDSKSISSSSGRYTKVVYTGEISTSSAGNISIHRQVWKNNSIDPDLMVPAGTRYPNGKVTTETISNRQLMVQGKAPFVLVENADGIFYQQIELHHTTGVETQRGSVFFRGDSFDGTMAEIPHGQHDQFSKALHFSKGRGESFRLDAVTGLKSDDAKKYEAFRSQYWRDRLKDFE